MELFEEILENLTAHLDKVRAAGVVSERTCNLTSAWPEKQSLVLGDETAVELGGPHGSDFMILWTGRPEAICGDRISLAGPDAAALAGAGHPGAPFTLIVMAGGNFENDYDTYRALRDTVFDTRPEGVSLRFWPDRRRIWCRVGRGALERGFSLIRYGCALLDKLQKLPPVASVELFFSTIMPPQCTLPGTITGKARHTVEALQKMYEERHFDCDNCEYNAVCEEVAALREIRERLRKERVNGE